MRRSFSLFTVAPACPHSPGTGAQEAAVHAQLAAAEAQLAHTLLAASTLPEGHPDILRWITARNS